jgi:branched-chain amino acid transport system ATP-binding protein
MILEVKDAHTFYGSSHILFGISLYVREGEVVCLLGRNGAGKTTTLRTIMGLTPARSGSVQFKGLEIREKPPYLIARLGMSFVPDTRKIIPDLTVRDNLIVGERKTKDGIWTIEKVYDLFPELKKYDSHLGDHLSGGEQQMLSIGRTLMCNPQLLLLDEPAEGLAPIVVKKLLLQLRKLVEENQTILMAEQNVQFATELGTRAYIIEKGTVKYEGSINELRKDEEIKRRFLAV